MYNQVEKNVTQINATFKAYPVKDTSYIINGATSSSWYQISLDYENGWYYGYEYWSKSYKNATIYESSWEYPADVKNYSNVKLSMAINGNYLTIKWNNITYIESIGSNSFMPQSNTSSGMFFTGTMTETLMYWLR